jgi:hypothetical protein
VLAAGMDASHTQESGDLLYFSRDGNFSLTESASKDVGLRLLHYLV